MNRTNIQYRSWRSTRVYVSLAMLCCFLYGYTQPGCPDPQATNYAPAATQNDGSCLYPVTYYTPTYRATLTSDLPEISGLQLADGEWWGHNDSGFDPDFFSFSPENGAVFKRIKLKDGHNHDWEDVCADAANLYFGDFGNNNNDRQNLGIYRVPFSAIGNSANQTVNADEYSFLPFAYPDQTDFTPQPEDSTVFDCESMIYVQNKLELFTKNRKEYQTTHYTLDPVSGAIQHTEAFDANGLITGASISPDGKLIALVGYDIRGLPTVFCWLLWDWPAGTNLFFSGNKRRIELGSAFSIGQVESVCFATNRSGYIANERTAYNGILFVAQTTRWFDFSEYLPPSVSTHSPALSQDRLQLYPNPCSGMLYLASDAEEKGSATMEIFNQLGMEVFTVQGLPDSLDLSGLPKGMYVVRVDWPDGEKGFYKLVRD